MPSTGRGGAGNILFASSPSPAPSATATTTTTTTTSTTTPRELEAAKPQSGITTDRSHAAATAPTTAANATHAYTGRGGAGNAYSPAALAQRGVFSDAGSSHVFGDGTPAPRAVTGDAAGDVGGGGGGGGTAEGVAPVAVRKHGRGGAGNFFVPDATAQREKEAERVREEARRMEVVSAEVERGVAASLAAPEKARLSD